MEKGQNKWLNTLDAVLRESSHVFMAFRERKRLFPSAVSTQRGQFSKSSALFRFVGPAVHSQGSDLSIQPSSGVFFPYPSNKSRSPRGSQGKIYHLMSTWGPQMRPYLALFSHTYLHHWCGCNKKEECVCISHPEEHTPPTVLNSCTAGRCW